MLAELLATPMRPGVVRWIGLRPARRAPMVEVASIALPAAGGLQGDHAAGARRQVTLIGAEDLLAIAAYLGRDRVPPELLRRNIVVAGINLLALKGQRFRLGEAVLEATGECHPCSRMEEALGPGGYHAVRGHGGITARVVTPGLVATGVPVMRVDALAPAGMPPCDTANSGKLR
jgi:MOSC domain-containing protein YiiM